METKVCTLYEFEGDNNTGELSFGVGEILTVTNENVDEGWWEGRKSDGTIGLFPQAYVEVLTSSKLNSKVVKNHTEKNHTEKHGNICQLLSESGFVLCVVPSSLSCDEDEESIDHQKIPHTEAQSDGPFPQMPAELPTQDPFQNMDPFQQTDVATSEVDPFGGFPQPPAMFDNQPSDQDAFAGVFDSQEVEQHEQQQEFEAEPENDYIDLTVNDWSSAASPASPSSSAVTPSPRSASISSDTPANPVKRSSTLRKSGIAKNILSSLTKSAGSSFVLGEATKANLSGSKPSRIVLSADGPMWENNPKIFTCTISNPMKATKFKIKNYIAYEVQPSFSKRSVTRRYKHFDWLYEQLSRKFGITISIPQLPDKQITGRYEDDFVEGRRAQLEAWLSRMGIHPIISQADVLNHFLTPHRQEKAWKAGKRKSEKDEVVGGAFLNTVETPNETFELNTAEATLETHIKFTRSMEDSCKQLSAAGLDQVKKCTNLHKKDYERFGQIFQSLSNTFALDNREVALPLTKAMQHTGKCYEAIGQLYGDQPQCDWIPLLTGINEYKAVLSTFPAILTNQKSALDKNKEIKRLQGEGKVAFDEMKNVDSRTEVLSMAVQAEINHFQHYRVGDFAGYMKDFLQQQIAFHQEIVKKLEEAAADYREMTEWD